MASPLEEKQEASSEGRSRREAGWSCLGHRPRTTGISQPGTLVVHKGEHRKHVTINHEKMKKKKKKIPFHVLGNQMSLRDREMIDGKGRV